MDIENSRAATWDPKDMVAYIYVSPTNKSIYTDINVSATVNVDVDDEGHIVGIEVML